MKEDSFEWFRAQVNDVRRHVNEEWPEWMKNTSDVAAAVYPSLKLSSAESGLRVDVKLQDNTSKTHIPS